MVARVRIFVALMLVAALIDHFEPAWDLWVFLGALSSYLVVVMPAMGGRHPHSSSW